MEQHEIRVSLSVRTKLLISLILLLTAVIFFLNISSIFLFREDKRNYIYETQATEALLASKEFVTNAKHVIDTLRTILSAIDTKQALTANASNIFQSIIKNQTEILSSYIYLVDITAKTHSELAKSSKVDQLEKLNLSADDFKISDERMELLIPDLKKNSYAFLNLSKLGSPPILAVAVTDPNQIRNSDKIPVAVGILSLKGFGNDLNNLKLTIATRSGWVLYDTDPTSLYTPQNISNIPLFKSALESRLANGAQEFDMNENHWLGSFVNPGLDLVVLTMHEWHRAMQATYKLAERFILMACMAISAATGFAVIFSKTLTAPLAALHKATKAVAQGDFLIKLEEQGRDEVAALTTSFNVMSSKIAELVEETAVKAKLEQELSIASTVQQTLIPPSDFLTEDFQIHSYYHAASQCGGDWWGFFSVGKRTCLIIADATGHGLPSALITASARSCFSVLHRLAEEDPDFTFSPSAMLPFANQVIFDASLGQIMMTAFIAVIDFETKTMRYANAGHNPPWLLRNTEGGVVAHSLVAPGPRLGENKEIPPYEEFELQLVRDDILIIYTDGLLEGTNASGKPYGKKRARSMASTHFMEGPTRMVDSIIKDFNLFNGQKKLDDDVTIAALKILR